MSEFETKEHVQPADSFFFVVFFVTACVSVNVLALSFGNAPALLGATPMGAIMGQLILAGWMAGLYGRHWLIGYGLSLSISLVIALLTLFVVFGIFGTPAQGTFNALIDVVRTLPLAISTCSIPPLLLRALLKWRIAKSPFHLSRLSIEDWLIATTIVGCILVLQVSMETELSLLSAPLAIGTGILGAIGTLLSIPIVLTLLSSNPNAESAARTFCYLFILGVLALTLFSFGNPKVGFAALLVYIGIVAMVWMSLMWCRAYGMKLFTCSIASAASIEKDDGEKSIQLDDSALNAIELSTVSPFSEGPSGSLARVDTTKRIVRLIAFAFVIVTCFITLIVSSFPITAP